MPGWSGAIGGNLIRSYGLNSGASKGLILPASSALNTKSAYLPLVNSLEFNASGFMLFGLCDVMPTTTACDILVDFAVGAAGSEKPIIDNLHFQCDRNEGGCVYNFPNLALPAGARISARSQNNGSTGTSIQLMLVPFGGMLDDYMSLQRVTTYGANLTTSGGLTVDPGGSANTKGSYVPITSSCVEPIKQMYISLSTRANPAQTSAAQLWDVATGAAGSEQVLFSFITQTGTQTDDIYPNLIGPIPLNIKVGTRIAIRQQNSITDATDRLIDVYMYGLD